MQAKNPEVHHHNSPRKWGLAAATQRPCQLLFLISPDGDHQRERNTPKHCRHQHAEEVSVEFQIDQSARQDQCGSTDTCQLAHG